MRLRLPARRESVASLRRAVVEFAKRSGATDRQREDIALAISEALSNTVLHAYLGHDRPGAMEVRASASARSLEVIVCDDGNGLIARDGSPGLGLGLSVIDRVTEHLELTTRRPVSASR
jgi:serine/threonine-protein kinase RsbW